MNKFKNLGMSVVAYANGFTLWHYKSDDTMEEICKPTYFPKSFADLCRNGDIMIVNAGDNTSIRTVSLIQDGETIELTKLN